MRESVTSLVFVFLALQICALDCVTSWSPWTPCSSSCGNGVRVRTMNIVSGGSDCVVAPPNLQYCNLRPCPTDCQWVWSNWTDCMQISSSSSLTSLDFRYAEAASPTPCGPGESSRDATVIQESQFGGKACPALPRQTVPCVLGPECPQDCVYRQNFSEWSASCGQARRVAEVQVLARERGGGKPCPQNTVEYRDVPCVQNCKLSEWSKWSACNSTCKGGYQSRARSVILFPSFGGKACDLRLEDTRMCNGDKECVETCMGKCGQEESSLGMSSTCKCDRMCESLNDCCSDFQTICPSFSSVFSVSSSSSSGSSSNAKTSSCRQRCGAQDGDILGCWCDENCVQTNDCCNDFESQCPSLAALVVTCKNRCGKQSSVMCSCDAMCVQRRDCCADMSQICQATSAQLTCLNRCGQYGPLGAAIAASPLASRPVTSLPWTPPGVPLHYDSNSAFRSNDRSSVGNVVPQPSSTYDRRSISSSGTSGSGSSSPYASPDFIRGRRLLSQAQSISQSNGVDISIGGRKSSSSSRRLLLKADWSASPSSCYCDGMCLEHGDCCSDYRSLCIPAVDSETSCRGKCGAILLSASCFCDDQCDLNQDCCSDKKSVCDVLPQIILNTKV